MGPGRLAQSIRGNPRRARCVLDGLVVREGARRRAPAAAVRRVGCWQRVRRQPRLAYARHLHHRRASAHHVRRGDQPWCSGGARSASSLPPPLRHRRGGALHAYMHPGKLFVRTQQVHYSRIEPLWSTLETTKCTYVSGQLGAPTTTLQTSTLRAPPARKKGLEAPHHYLHQRHDEAHARRDSAILPKLTESASASSDRTALNGLSAARLCPIPFAR